MQKVNEKFNCFVRPDHFSTVSQSFHLVKEFHMDKACEERQCGKEGWNKVRNILLSFCCFIWLLRSKYVTLFEIMQSTLSYHAGVKTNLDSTKCQTLCECHIYPLKGVLHEAILFGILSKVQMQWMRVLLQDQQAAQSSILMDDILAFCTNTTRR